MASPPIMKVMMWWLYMACLVLGRVRLDLVVQMWTLHV